MDGFRFGFEDDGWEFDSGMGRSESTYGDGELEIGWRTGSGGELDDGRGEGELSEEDGVRSGGELDGREFSEDGDRGDDGSGGDGSVGAKSASVGFNSESVLEPTSRSSGTRPICPIKLSASANQEDGLPSPLTSSS